MFSFPEYFHFFLPLGGNPRPSVHFWKCQNTDPKTIFQRLHLREFYFSAFYYTLKSCSCSWILFLRYSPERYLYQYLIIF